MAELPFGFDTPEDSPGFLLWQTTITWQRLIKKALDPFEISHAQFVVLALSLWLEAHQKEATQMMIIKLSKLDKMTVSQALKKLSVLNFVERQEHATDTRVKKVQLTDEGRKLIHQLVPLVEAVDKQFFGVLSSSEQQNLLSLHHIINNS